MLGLVHDQVLLQSGRTAKAPTWEQLSHRERLLGSRVLLNNTSFGLNHLSKWSSGLLHYEGNTLPLVFPCIHLQFCHDESSEEKLSITLASEI